MTQWAVVWRPDPTHVVRVLGPYRSALKAHKVEAAMEALETELDIASGFNDDPMSLLPQVVPFEDWRDVQRELRAKYAEDTYDESLDACPACDTLPSNCHGGCCEDCNHASSWHAGMVTGSSERSWSDMDAATAEADAARVLGSNVREPQP